MKLTTLPCLLAALCSTTHVLANAIEDRAPAATPAPELISNDPQPHLEPRQGAIVSNPAATLNPEQYPIATTQWIESTAANGGAITYVSVVYTQTFAPTPDPWYTAGKGTIGLGTLTMHGKREVVQAVETDNYNYTLAIAVLEIRNELVTLFVQPVTEVMVLHTVMVLANASNATVGNGAVNSTFPGGFNGTLWNGTLANGTANGTGGGNISSVAASGSAMAYNSSIVAGTGSGSSSGAGSFALFESAASDS
ncbi:hypothetical protein LTR48_000797 [Friedmanniomyces endolithicus]|uniref:Uncharacterized protein n=1 Tax=Rachicladosporium monterosium TaxID=1507873 RepID=A0ABR0L3I6_9PEZI|nr:hypothetical protein LTR48_000797 [Friedmanniomyces endolithicus]KAK5142950.1 hypothetical protein LTR32_004818 [Rachicladosporium monterosium]